MGASNYSSDFQTVDAAYDPVSPVLYFGAEPLMLLVLFLVLLALFALGFYVGQWYATRDQGPSRDPAPGEIHKAVLLASHAAMSADSRLLLSKATDLRAVIERLLGPVLVLGRGLGGPVKALDDAIKGEVKEEARVAPCACGRPGGVCSCAARAPVSVTQVVVNTGSPSPAGEGATPPATANAQTAPAEPRRMTVQQQTDALSKAVRSFHDYWSKSADRIGDLKAARSALSRRPPASTLKTGGGHSVGGHH